MEKNTNHIGKVFPLKGRNYKVVGDTLSWLRLGCPLLCSFFEDCNNGDIDAITDWQKSNGLDCCSGSYHYEEIEEGGEL